MKRVESVRKNWVDKLVAINPNVQRIRGPSYLNRHAGRDFLVLGNGPSLSDHRESILALIDEKNLIVMGVNRISGFVTPDYHTFGNKKTFLRDAETANFMKSNILIGQYIPRRVVKHNLKGNFEWVLYKNNKDEFSIKNGFIYGGGRTTTGLLIGVAMVMGGSQIYVAGMDGYSSYLESGRDLWFHGTIGNYKGDGREGRAYYKALDDAANADLKQIKAYQEKSGRKVFQFVTPTSYRI
jgi:4-hydroxy 2-oxovalerate aldolase